MWVKEFSAPDDETLASIRRIELECRLYDGLQGRVFIEPSLNFNPSVKSVFVGYEGPKPVAFVSLFIPTPAQAELVGMTLPKWRGKGCFSELASRAAAEVARWGIPDILYVCEGSSGTGRAAIEKIGAAYEFTEYLLTYSHACDSCIMQTDPRCSLKKAEGSDLELLTDMNVLIFDDGKDRRLVRNIIKSSIMTADRDEYILLYNGTPAGMAATFEEYNTYSIYGLGILPQLRGRGLGRQLLYLMLRRLLPNGKSIRLEVDGGNHAAFNLYTTSGFVQECAIAYYRKHIVKP